MRAVWVLTSLAERCFWSLRCLAMISIAGFATLAMAAEPSPPVITNAAAVRALAPEIAASRLPIRLQGVVTYYFDTGSCFVQDGSAGIFVGNGQPIGALAPGDLVEVAGVSGAGDFAPIVQPTRVSKLGRVSLPPPRPASYDDLMTGREDSQWVEVEGLVRAVHRDPTSGGIMELASGGGRLTAFVPEGSETNLLPLIDAAVRVKGVCGTWFNKQRQLFGIRLMVSRTSDIAVVEPADPAGLRLPAQPIGNLMRFVPGADATGRRVKVCGRVILHQPGRALFVQDEQHGLYVRTRQTGDLWLGDEVELIGFPAKGEYTPTLEDAVWRRKSAGPEPMPVAVRPDEALAGLLDARLIAIEGQLLDRAFNNNELSFVIAADDQIFSAHLEATESPAWVASLQNGSRLRLTGVCRIEVGERWQAGPTWRAKSFRVLLRNPADVVVLKLPPWWTLQRALWAIGLLLAAVVGTLVWVTQLHRKVNQQTALIRTQRDVEVTLKNRYQDLFENANDTVYTHELHGKLTSINFAGEHLLGYRRDRIVGRNLLEFVVEEQRGAARQWLEQIVDGVAPANVEWDFVTVTAERVRLEISTRLIAREGTEVEVEGIARDVTERRRLENEILEISTREQRRIGHDLHDGVCQQLAGIAFLSEILSDRLGDANRAEAADAQKITELVNQANKQTRSVARGLFPVRLEENGLASSLEELAVNAGTFFNTKCEFRTEGEVAIADHTAAHHLYYIAHESIVNAVKHGKASLVQVLLVAEAPGQCRLAIRDNGVGLSATTATPRGMGIRIMEYRARLIRATVKIANRPEGGVEVSCRFVNQAGRASVGPASERPTESTGTAS